MLIAILFIIVGVLAIIEPLVAGLAVAVLAGWALLAAGVVYVVGAFGAGGIGRGSLHVIIGVIYFIGGVYLVTHPLLALGTLTLWIAVVLLVEAVLEIAGYVQIRREHGAGWRLFNGIVTIVLGLMIWDQWPSSSVWAIGTLVGVNLLLTGSSRLMLAGAARRALR